MTRVCVISSRRGLVSEYQLTLLEEAKKLARPILDKEAIFMLCILLMIHHRHIKRVHEHVVIGFLKDHVDQLPDSVLK